MTPESTPPASEALPKPAPEVSPAKAGLKLLLDFGPLVLFFWLNSHYRNEEDPSDITGALIATQGFMIALAVAFPVSWYMERKLPVMGLVTAVIVGIFGGLTIYLKDGLFFQLKPTVASLLFAGILLGGLARGKVFLKILMGAAMPLDDEGWRKLTVRWSAFFLFLAACNEVVRLSFDWDTWVSWKVWGILPLTIVFTVSQVPLMKRHEVIKSAEADEPEAS